MQLSLHPVLHPPICCYVLIRIFGLDVNSLMGRAVPPIIGPGRDTFLAASSQFPGQQSPPPSPGRGCRRPQLCFSNPAHWFWLGRGDGRTTLHCLRVGAAADPDAISLTRPNGSRQGLGRYGAPFTPGLS